MITTPSQLVDGMPPIALDCACCDQRLSERDEYCPECLTPASLSRTVATRVGKQNFISVLGASNAGKTVYLGLLLDILSKGPEQSIAALLSRSNQRFVPTVSSRY